MGCYIHSDGITVVNGGWSMPLIFFQQTVE